MSKYYWFRKRSDISCVRLLAFSDEVGPRIFDFGVGIMPDENDYCKELPNNENFSGIVKMMQSEAKDALFPIENEGKLWDQTEFEKLSPLEKVLIQTNFPEVK